MVRSHQATLDGTLCPPAQRPILQSVTTTFAANTAYAHGRRLLTNPPPSFGGAHAASSAGQAAADPRRGGCVVIVRMEIKGG